MTYAETGDELQEVAAAWAVRLDRGDLTGQEQQDLEAWLDGDVRRVGALARAQAVWCDIDRLAALDRAGVDPMDLPARRMTWRPWRQAAATVAALLVVAGAAAGWMHTYAGREDARVGEIRRMVLSDGSVVVLNTDSIVQVRYHAHQRDIFLRKGEASFQVAHNRSRPFVVHAGGVSVRAVGTAFAVREGSHGVLVTVAEGVVEVARKSGARTTSADASFVHRDQQVVVAPGAPLRPQALSDEAVSRRLSWREGLLMFDGETLGQAVVEVNRYAPTRVVIDDPALAKRAFVGVFQAGDSRAFAKAAAVAFNAHAEQDEDGAIHLTPEG
jgi:transmembrane sensor